MRKGRFVFTQLLFRWIWVLCDTNYIWGSNLQGGIKAKVPHAIRAAFERLQKQPEKDK